MSDADGGLADEDGGVAGSIPAARVGVWSGTTSQFGRTLGFVLTKAGMTELTLTWGSLVACMGDNMTQFMPPIVLGNTFSTTFALASDTQLTFAGSFEDDSTASGTLVFTTPGAGPLSCGVGNATWRATLQPPEGPGAVAADDAGVQTP